MSLQFVFGSSGSGKSHKIYTEIINDSIKNINTNYIIIVPEQFTLQTQKNMVAMHPSNGILNIDVLSFVRLAYKIFNEIGYNPGVVLDDAGKNMILRKIMSYEEDKLVLFKGNIKKQGFISELKSLISEFGQYSIGPEDISKIEEKLEDNALKIKLKETGLVYSAFKDYLQEKYIMAEEVYSTGEK
jgi:ATP-dependent helicase/nuclease subunit B